MMQAIRDQLADTQGFLQKRDKEFRELKMSTKQEEAKWEKEASEYQKRIQQLETEVRMLRQNGAAKAQDNGASGSNMVSLPRADKEAAERRYQRLKDQLAEKTTLSEALKSRVERLTGLDITKDQVIGLFLSLNNAIKQLVETHLGNYVVPDAPGAVYEPFDTLTENSQRYFNNKKMASYMFRAFFWRCLDTWLFRSPCCVLGEATYQMMLDLSKALPEPVASKNLEWQRPLLAAFRRDRIFDKEVLNYAAETMYGQTAMFLPTPSGSAATQLQSGIAEVVFQGAELAAIFASSQYASLMSNNPSSNRRYGFKYQEDFMTMQSGLSVGDTVDLVVAPCLLEQEDDYKVLAKEEVIGIMWQ